MKDYFFVTRVKRGMKLIFVPYRVKIKIGIILSILYITKTKKVYYTLAHIDLD